MPPLIHFLDEETINQIAAGEVVENSASVVKELIENAIDASACNICIEIIAGGKQLIRVQDNGRGMHPADALLSLKRHATSKIRNSSDLELLLTKGFRGEALAAIGSVSKLRLITNHSLDEEAGSIIIQEGGKILETGPALHKQGTTIEVASLFYNTPARRKFQRSAQADTHAIFKCVEKQALSHPEVHFELFQGSEKLLLCPKASLEERMRLLMGDQEFIPITAKEGPYALKGFISHPLLSRSNRTGQYLFINQRAVSSAVISQGVLEGYATLLENRRFPLFVLHLTMEPHLVDVNVHPQKEEVRLREESFLRRWLAETISCALHIPLPSPFHEKDQPELPWESFSAKSFIFEKPSLKILAEQLSFDKCPFPIVGSWKKYLLIDPICVPSQHHLVYKEDSLLILYRERARETLLNAQLKAKEPPASCYLTEPLAIELSPAEKSALQSLPLEEWGFIVRSFGPKTVLVEALPVALNPLDVKEIFLACLTTSSKPIEKVAHLLRGDTLSPSLWLDAFFALEHIQWSPSGEPNFFICALNSYKKN
ncbi:MAG: DNA mismatch repair endonuclease MutL [Chlamydiae bacterium]|nr:DNA mismatch repair endonuclease MutL [Chlamydiota bacterium]